MALRASADPDLALLPERISEVPRRWALETPDALALRDGESEWTYGRLAVAIDEAKNHLGLCGVRPGDRVVVVNENCMAVVAILFAVAELDAWVVLTNARLTAREIDGIAENSGARLTLFTHTISADAEIHAIRLSATRQLWGSLGEISVGLLSETCEPESVCKSGAEQVAALVYTTGTTGNPKGVMLTHHNLLHVATVSAKLRHLTNSDRAYGVLPISHVYGLASVTLGTLSAGACLQVAARFSAAAAANALMIDGITVFQGVPAMYAKLIEHVAEDEKFSAPKLHFTYAGGSPLDPALKARAEARLGLTLHNGYGLTESSPTVSQTRLDRPRRDCSVGEVIPGIRVRTVNSQGVDVGIGEPGELWVNGPNVMKGYYRDPESTARVIRDGWLNTGDIATIAADGAMFIVGRTKELIIRSGFNVYPVEVEAVLNSHPAVSQSAVVGRSVTDNEEVVAFVELKPGLVATGDEIGLYVSDLLSPYKRPSEIIIMPVLPAAATGKILKKKLKEMAQRH
ncbi:MAG: AMP-binding protein [Betaproteobacteria bacterium]